MKLRRIKYENIFLLFVLWQFIDWYFKGAINEYCIIYYTFIYIIYNTIKYIRKYKED